MRIQWELWAWWFRPLRWLTAVSASTALVAVLWHEKPLRFFQHDWVIPFVLLHTFMISRLIGRVRSESFGFLYSQGFSRDVLWGHAWLAAGASVLATWLPCAVAVLTPLRGMFQDSLLNPWFPLMASTEGPFIGWTLLLYVVLLPVFQYEWIRSAMPHRDLVSGHLLAIGFVVFGGLVGERMRPMLDEPVRWWFVGGFAVIAAVLGVFGRWMHRRLEVLS